MPKVTTIAECLQMDEGLPVTAVSGIVKYWNESNSGSNERGDWKIQNLTLVDPTDKKLEIKVMVCDKDDVPASAKGKKIYLESVNGKHGWTGVKTSTDKKTNKLILKVTSTGVISLDGFPSEEHAPGDDGEQQEQPPAQTQGKPAQDKPMPVFGATVGMAVNNAYTALREAGCNPGTDTFNKTLHEWASDIIRVAQYLEAGKLAPKVSDRKPVSQEGAE